tara:strand:+ start:24214 stop:25176 length:963 start_codon:yes stop_codon:yes gene_type:complete
MSGPDAMSDADRLINILLSPSLERKTFGSMAEWFKDFNQQTRQFLKPLDRAMLGGRLSLNVGFAFTSGYQSAIEALFKPEKIQLSSFCVTEEKGNHSRAIETRVFKRSDELFVSGGKSFVSGANDSECLYIACRDERNGSGVDADGRPIIKMISIKTESEGIDIQAMPALGFIPEVSHGKVILNNVAVNEEKIFSGDGYLNYIKAFRSYEDLHVLAAITGYRLGEAMDGLWPQDVLEKHIALLLALRSLSNMNLNKPAAHIGLATCRAQMHELIMGTDAFFEQKNSQAYDLWMRDKVLLNVAQTAHQKRTQRAWESFDSL